MQIKQSSRIFAQIEKMELKTSIEAAWQDRGLLKEAKYSDAVRAVIEEVDKGRLRVAEPQGDQWVVNEWVKQAILMLSLIHISERTRRS